MKPLLVLSETTSYCETVSSPHEAFPHPSSDWLHDRDGKHGDLVCNQGVGGVLTSTLAVGFVRQMASFRSRFSEQLLQGIPLVLK